METSQCPNFEQCPFLTSLLSGGDANVVEGLFLVEPKKINIFSTLLRKGWSFNDINCKSCKGSASQRTALKCKTIQHNSTQSNTIKHNEIQSNTAQ